MSARFIFSPRMVKKYPELIPLVAIISGACTMATGFVLYALYTKPDVKLAKTDEMPYSKLKGSTRTKLYIYNPEVYKDNPDIEKLRREIGSYKS